MNLRRWTWDFRGLLTCRCLACARCRGQLFLSTTGQLTHSLRIARMTNRLVPLLFPAVDQPISKLSSQVLWDCPRWVVGAQQAAPLPESRILKDAYRLPRPRLRR